MEITDMNEAEVVSYRYTPYGAVTITVGGTPQSSDPLGNPWMFTGRFLDEETGLYYFRARTYSPSMGRFLQRDPLGVAAGPSLYEYAFGAPSVHTDPLGLAPPTLDDAPGGPTDPFPGPCLRPWWTDPQQWDRWGRMHVRHCCLMETDFGYRTAFWDAEGQRATCRDICESKRRTMEGEADEDYADDMRNASRVAGAAYMIAFAPAVASSFWSGPWAIVIGTAAGTAAAVLAYESEKADAERQKSRRYSDAQQAYEDCLDRCRIDHPLPPLL
jgi:RHS repeat-associated protein